MANRSYLFSLSNRPSAYADRPETVCGLSEFPYFVPFSYRVLMSGEPQVCASLISDGLDDEPGSAKTSLFAISSPFEPGFARLQKLCAVLREVASDRAPALRAALDGTEEFLAQRRNEYLLLETVELDMMSDLPDDGQRLAVEKEITACRRAGAAVDALPANVQEAAAQLRRASLPQSTKPKWKFWSATVEPSPISGLLLDDDFDSTRAEKTEYPLGLYWSDMLYFQLWNREKFAAEHRD
jgi:hypothetical protein